MRATLIALALAASLLASACAAPPADSGIKGMVTIGPISPVQREGEPSDAPYQATITVKKASGGKVAEVTSGADGRFSVNLAPGSYTLVPETSGPPPSASPVNVTVEGHRFTEVTISYDSGIR